MGTSTEPGASIPAELAHRHKATRTTVCSLLIAVVLVCVLASVTQKFLTPRNNPSLHMAVLITILIFGFGAIAFRRTKFATMRLQDIAGLQGASGLLISLQRTTLHVALIGMAIVAVGFAATLFLGNPSYTYRAGVVAAGVLLYCYPVRSSWEKVVQRFVSVPNTSSPPKILANTEN